MAETKKKKTTKQDVLEIYVGEDKMSVAQTVQAQICYLAMQTPEKYIMKREGRGGHMLDYVETNYVIGRLNATFFFDWDSEILEQIIDRDNNQIAMKIRLTARFANGKEVKKDAWGGSAIKFSGSKMIDLADDLKSAESDGIKKAASMLGVCWDVYSGLTGNGRKKKTDDGFTSMPGPPDTKSEFRTIAIMINKKKIMHTKYEALDRFEKAKEQLGEELYYEILGENGYEKSNQIPPKDIPRLYYAMAKAFKQGKKASRVKSTPKDKPTQAQLIELSKLETILIDKHNFSPNQILNQFKETVDESIISNMTKAQVVTMIAFFKSCIADLNKAAEK